MGATRQPMKGNAVLAVDKAKTLAEVMDEHPDLGDAGFEGVWWQIDAATVAEDRAALAREGALFDYCVEWLAERLDPAPRLTHANSSYGSYGLKHNAERGAPDGYVPNGVMVAALLALGYPSKQVGPNLYPAIRNRRKTVELLFLEQRDASEAARRRAGKPERRRNMRELTEGEAHQIAQVWSDAAHLYRLGYGAAALELSFRSIESWPATVDSGPCPGCGRPVAAPDTVAHQPWCGAASMTCVLPEELREALEMAQLVAMWGDA